MTQNISFPVFGQRLYLNANLVLSDILTRIKQKKGWKNNQQAGTLKKLSEEGYELVTSSLTRMEVIKNLLKEFSQLDVKKASNHYFNCLKIYEMSEINVQNNLKLTPSLLTRISTSNLELKDALHLTLCKHLKIKVCTHDKKMNNNWSQQKIKEKFYNEVYKPEELITQKKKKFRK